MASFRKRVTARTRAVRWQARYVGLDGDIHAATFVRKADAEAWAKEQEAKCLSGDWAPPSKITFSEWAAQWTALRQDLRPATRHAVASHIRIHLLPAFGRRPLMAIDPVEVRTFASEVRRFVAQGRVR